MRLDKFLKVSRLIKRRTVANEACDAGRVLVNGKTAKASLNVKEGDMVQTGDIVGTVGSTGYSTGPHLHYSLLVNNVFINPWTAFEHGI